MPAMSQPEGKGGAALEVKFVPDEEVLKHITDDAGTAGPGQRPARRRPPLPGRWETVPGSRGAPREGSPSPTPGAAERLGRAAGRTRPSTSFSAGCFFRDLFLSAPRHVERGSCGTVAGALS